MLSTKLDSVSEVHLKLQSSRPPRTQSQRICTRRPGDLLPTTCQE